MKSSTPRSSRHLSRPRCFRSNHRKSCPTVSSFVRRRSFRTQGILATLSRTRPSWIVSQLLNNFVTDLKTLSKSASLASKRVCYYSSRAWPTMLWQFTKDKSITEVPLSPKALSRSNTRARVKRSERISTTRSCRDTMKNIFRISKDSNCLKSSSCRQVPN